MKGMYSLKQLIDPVKMPWKKKKLYQFTLWLEIVISIFSHKPLTRNVAMLKILATRWKHGISLLYIHLSNRLNIVSYRCVYSLYFFCELSVYALCTLFYSGWRNGSSRNQETEGGDSIQGHWDTDSAFFHLVYIWPWWEGFGCRRTW